MKRFLAVLPLAALGVALAQVSGPAAGPPQRRAAGISELRAYLDLTDAQLEQMRQIRTQAAEENRATATQLREQQKVLRDLLASPNPDPAAVGKQQLQVKTLREQLQNARESVRQSVLNVLTPDQKTKLAALEEAAKLRPAIAEAMRLGLIEGPQPPAGRMGPAGRGPGAGPNQPMRGRGMWR